MNNFSTIVKYSIVSIILSTLLTAPTFAAPIFNAPRFFSEFENDPRPLLQLDEVPLPSKLNEIRAFILTTNIALGQPGNIRFTLTDGKNQARAILVSETIENGAAKGFKRTSSFVLNVLADAYQKLNLKKTALKVYSATTNTPIAIFNNVVVAESTIYVWRQKGTTWNRITTHAIKTAIAAGDYLIDSKVSLKNYKVWLVNPYIDGVASVRFILKDKKGKTLAKTLAITIAANEPMKTIVLDAGKLKIRTGQLWAAVGGFGGKEPAVRILTLPRAVNILGF